MINKLQLFSNQFSLIVRHPCRRCRYTCTPVSTPTLAPLCPHLHLHPCMCPPTLAPLCPHLHLHPCVHTYTCTPVSTPTLAPMCHRLHCTISTCCGTWSTHLWREWGFDAFGKLQTIRNFALPNFNFISTFQISCTNF